MEKKTALKWLYSIIGNLKYHILSLTVLNSAISLCAVFFAYEMRYVIDCATSKQKDLFIRHGIIIVAIILSQLIIYVINKREDEYVRSRIENKIKVVLYKNILYSDYQTVTSIHSGELLNLLTNDTVVITDGIVSIIPNVASMLVKLVGASFVLIQLDYQLAIIFLIGGVFLSFFTIFFRRFMKSLHKVVQEKDGLVRSFLQESLSNLLIIKAYTQEDKSCIEAKNRMDEHYSIRMKRNTYTIISNVGFSLVMNIGYLFGVIWCGFGILNGDITYGVLTAVLQLINQIQQPFANVSSYLPKYYSMIASTERILEVIDLPHENKKMKNYYQFNNIQCKNISFHYKDGEDILNETSLLINYRDSIGIIGESGIGKSTLLKMLLGLYRPYKGKCYLNMDGKKVVLDETARTLFSYVPQGNYLLSGTIKESITFFSNTPLDERLMKQACYIACISDTIESLPLKYDTYIGERGNGLSEGQIQRIAIARAIYNQAPILLLDECTSALDEITERKVIHNIKELTDKTMVIVTHRKEALKLCNRIIKIKNKKFIEKD